MNEKIIQHINQSNFGATVLWSRIIQEVNEVVSQCHVCQISKHAWKYEDPRIFTTFDGNE